MIMTKKYKILAKYIKDMSSETPDVETYIFTRDNISNYQLNININSKAIKNKHIEVNTNIRYEDKQDSKKKSHFEIIFSSIIKVDEEVKEKKEFEKIILVDVQTEIYPDLEKSLLNLLHNSGYKNVRFEKKIDFENLYNQKFN
tara:strand:+ start:675 stop:1103 length:429 start_codon:yes stop_codon:yes gene_type:complete